MDTKIKLTKLPLTDSSIPKKEHRWSITTQNSQHSVYE